MAAIFDAVIDGRLLIGLGALLAGCGSVMSGLAALTTARKEGNGEPAK